MNVKGKVVDGLDFPKPLEDMDQLDFSHGRIPRFYPFARRCTGTPPEKHSGVQRIVGFVPTIFLALCIASSKVFTGIKPMPLAYAGALGPTMNTPSVQR
jgi:hypothetical protein